MPGDRGSSQVQRDRNGLTVTERQDVSRNPEAIVVFVSSSDRSEVVGIDHRCDLVEQLSLGRADWMEWRQWIVFVEQKTPTVPRQQLHLVQARQIQDDVAADEAEPPHAEDAASIGVEVAGASANPRLGRG